MFEKKYLIIGGIIVAFVGLLMFNGQKAPQELVAWIEITNPSVFTLEAPQGNVLKELQTGDQVQRGDIIKTDLEATANIYISDGSIVRISPDTEFVLDEISFDKDKKQLGVQIQLNKGKIWSKVFELSTPDSFWEVKTTNTVAVVRGTAFGVEVVDGTTKVIGSENTVEVLAINPQTQQIIEGNIAMVTPGKVIEISDEEIEAYEAEESLLEELLEDFREDQEGEEWVREHEKEDSDYDDDIELLEELGLEKEEVRDEVIKKVEEKYRRHQEEERSDTEDNEIKDSEEVDRESSVSSEEEDGEVQKSESDRETDKDQNKLETQESTEDKSNQYDGDSQSDSSVETRTETETESKNETETKTENDALKEVKSSEASEIEKVEQETKTSDSNSDSEENEKDDLEGNTGLLFYLDQFSIKNTLSWM